MAVSPAGTEGVWAMVRQMNLGAEALLLIAAGACQVTALISKMPESAINRAQAAIVLIIHRFVCVAMGRGASACLDMSRVRSQALMPHPLGEAHRQLSLYALLTAAHVPVLGLNAPNLGFQTDASPLQALASSVLPATVNRLLHDSVQPTHATMSPPRYSMNAPHHARAHLNNQPLHPCKKPIFIP